MMRGAGAGADQRLEKIRKRKQAENTQMCLKQEKRVLFDSLTVADLT